MTVSTVKPTTPTPIVSPVPPVPRDLVVRVGKLAGFAVYFNGDQPLYKERLDDLYFGADHEVEVEFSLPMVTLRILNRAPKLTLVREDHGYLCSLKLGQQPARGASMTEAVFRAFAEAKAEAKAA